MPALGGAVVDGSMSSWESCSPIRFQSDKDQTVEVRGLYDPEHLYLRWHVRLARAFTPQPMEPIERIFTHDRLADTLGFYIQGDPTAAAGGPSEGRPGDARFVFGIFQDGDKVRPAALGMYPHWNGSSPARPQTYATPTGNAVFANVAPVDGVEMAHFLDTDRKGFVLLAAIPRSAIPGIPTFTDKLRTMVNFDATVGGHDKFWWANRDGSASRETYDEPTEARLYPGSWAPAQFQGLREVLIRDWSICGPWGGPGAEKFREDLSGEEKDRGRAFSAAAKYPPDNGVVDLQAVFKGQDVHGYWPDPGEVRWKKASVADLDTRESVSLAPRHRFGTARRGFMHRPTPNWNSNFKAIRRHTCAIFSTASRSRRVRLPGPTTGGVLKKAVGGALRQGWNRSDVSRVLRRLPAVPSRAHSRR